MLEQHRRQEFGIRERFDLDQLAWLLDLLQKPSAGKGSEDDRENFASFGRGIADESPPIDPAALRRIVGEVKQGVECFVRDRQPWEIKLSAGTFTRRIEWNGPLPEGRYKANWRVAFMLRVSQLLERYGARIRECQWPDCQRLFVANKRQIFCSSNCSLKARQKRFRESLPPEELRKRRQEAYRRQEERNKGTAARS